MYLKVINLIMPVRTISLIKATFTGYRVVVCVFHKSFLKEKIEVFYLISFPLSFYTYTFSLKIILFFPKVNELHFAKTDNRLKEKQPQYVFFLKKKNLWDLK